MPNIVKHESAWQNPWVWLLVGIMGTAILVNGVLITLAFMFPPGLVVDDYYERGKNYLYHQAQVKDDVSRLGWEIKLDLPNSPSVNSEQSYLLRVVDAKGIALEGANVELAAYRPVHSDNDFVVAMRDIGAGYYSAKVNFGLPGNWDLIATVKSGDDALDIAQRVFVEKAVEQ